VYSDITVNATDPSNNNVDIPVHKTQHPKCVEEFPIPDCSQIPFFNYSERKVCRSSQKIAFNKRSNCSKINDHQSVSTIAGDNSNNDRNNPSPDKGFQDKINSFSRDSGASVTSRVLE